MANEVRIARQESSLTIYFAVRNSSGQVWDTVAGSFGSIGSVTWTNADIAMLEQSTTGDYFGSFPSGISPGTYTIEVFEQIGASPVRKDDTLLATSAGLWRGGRLMFTPDLLADVMSRAGRVL